MWRQLPEGLPVRSPITATHLLALANPPEAMALLLHMVSAHGVSINPTTQRPRLCAWSMDDLYQRCVAAARIGEP
jgi:hypothetical protein